MMPVSSARPNGLRRQRDSLALPPIRSSAMSNIAIVKLELTGPLTEAEKAAIVDACREEATYAAGADLAREGDHPQHSSVILEGRACRYKLLDGGKRQIMSFHI